jgi:endonuclease/exonuclease/phosphatase family metal-dependent hydrolase
LINLQSAPPQPHLKSEKAVGLRHLIFLLLITMILGSTGSTGAQEQSDLFETGHAAKPSKPTESTNEVSVVSYNIRWRTRKELDQISNWLKEKGAAVIALQEVDRGKKRTGKTNNARVLANALGMQYAWAAPPPVKDADEEETGVELLSRYPLTDVKRMVLPHLGPGGRSRVALGATLTIGTKKIRVYSVHAENRMSEPRKIEQLKAVLTDLAAFPKGTPAIVMGDFNTWEPAMVDRTRELFMNEGFTTPFPDGRATFKRKIVLFDLELKLDWIWLRGLAAKDFEIDRKFTVSDHFPLLTVVSF